MAAQVSALGISYAPATMAPTYLPAPSIASLIVADGFSILAASQQLAAIASTMESESIKLFDGYFAGRATAGWEDSSVVAYRAICTRVSGELGQMQKAISAASTMLASVASLLGAFWLAFLGFTLPFFVTITELTLTAIGPQAAVLQPIIQALGLLAGQKWLAAAGTVISVLVAGGTMILGFVKELSNFQRFDETGDNVPDLQQIKIAWEFDGAP
ncbi:MAG TPA: hypothetical protein VK453_01810 [Micromonosporaceae bacterium]|nr:hypothetical protein [Micromonosporaceae bacterium]